MIVCWLPEGFVDWTVPADEGEGSEDESVYHSYTEGAEVCIVKDEEQTPDNIDHHQCCVDCTNIQTYIWCYMYLMYCIG